MTKQIADMTLAAGTSKQMTFVDLQGDPQLQNSFLVTSDGEAGDVLAKLVSHDAYSPELSVELLGKDAQDTNNGGSNPWSIEKGAESTLLLFNHDQALQIFNVLIASADGSQWNKDFKLAPMETRAVSVGELIQNAAKDDKGKTLPKTAVSGQISWWTVGTPSGPGHGRLLLSNRASVMSRNFSCGCPYLLCGVSFVAVYDTIIYQGTESPLDYLSPVICLYKVNTHCGGTVTSNSSSQALHYSWTADGTYLQAFGSTSNYSVGGYGATLGRGTMTGTVSATYNQPPQTCAFQQNGPTPVEPQVTIDSFSPNPIAQGGTANVHFTVNPSATINLAITQATGATGTATFGTGGNTTMTISQTTTVTVTAGNASSNGAADLTLTASYSGKQLTSENFSVTSGACTATYTGSVGSGLYLCPSSVTLTDTYNLVQYCSACTFVCQPINYDSSFTPSGCFPTNAGLQGAGSQSLSATQKGTFKPSDCNVHLLAIKTSVTNAQGLKQDYQGSNISLQCNANGSPACH